MKFSEEGSWKGNEIEINTKKIIENKGPILKDLWLGFYL